MPQKKKKGGTLSEEQQWMDVQKRTFTNWVNDKLSSSEHRVVDLAKDLDDGVVLIELLQKLTGKIVPER